MSNIFLDIPVPAGNGVGAPVDTTGMGNPKTVEIAGDFRGSVIIEASLDGGITYSAVWVFTTNPKKKVLNFAADRVRVRRSGVPNIGPGLPSVSISANNFGALFAALPVGIAVNTSALGNDKTVTVNGLSTHGVINIEVSEDGINWATCLTFNNDDIQFRKFTAKFMRAMGTGATVNVGAVNDESGGVDAGTCLVYQPGGGGTGPVVYEDWNALIGQLNTIRAATPGCEVPVIIDDSFSSPAVIPSGSYDLVNVVLTAIVDNPATLEISDGVTFNEFRHAKGPLTVSNMSTSPVDTSLVDGEQIVLEGGAIVGSGITTAAPIWSSTGVNAGESFTVVLDFARLSSKLADFVAAPVIDVNVANSEAIFELLEAGIVIDDAIIGDATAEVTFLIKGSSAQTGTHAGIANRTDTPQTFDRYDIQPIRTSPGSVLFAQGWFPFDTTSGDITPRLPDAKPENFGAMIGVENVLGTNSLNVTPQSGETIDDVPGPFTIIPGQSVVFLSNGAGNWKIESARIDEGVPDQGGVERTIFVRPTGSDTTGNGRSTSTAYRTIARALNDVPNVIRGIRYIIDCTDLGTEEITEPLVFPPLYCTDGTIFDFTPAIPGFIRRSPLTLQAAPTVIDTITAGELSGQTIDPVSTLRTLNTTKNLVLDVYRGKQVRDANGITAAIASNTAGPNSDIKIARGASLTAPIEIIEPSCEIRNTNAATGNGVDLRAVNAHVQFNGIKFSTANPSSFVYGIFLSTVQQRIGFDLCAIDGIFMTAGVGGVTAPLLISTSITKRVASSGLGCSMFSCFVDSSQVDFRHSGSVTDTMFWFECIFDSCDEIGGGTGIEITNEVNLSLDRSEITNGTSDGIFCPPGGRMRIRRTNIIDCVGDGVTVNGSPLVQIDNVQGSGNGGLGVSVQNGAQVQRLGGAAVTGVGGDYKVGGNAATAGGGVGWAAFGGNETDLAAATPQLCRLYT